MFIHSSYNSLLVYLIYCIGLAGLFRKTKDPIWKAFIPLYNIYVLWQRIWNTKYIWYAFLATAGLAVISTITGGDLRLDSHNLGHLILCLLGIALAFFLLAVSWAFYGLLAQSFGYKTLMTICLILCPILGIYIIAFGRHPYAGNGIPVS